jgi:hypothetical protein
VRPPAGIAGLAQQLPQPLATRVGQQLRLGELVASVGQRNPVMQDHHPLVLAAGYRRTLVRDEHGADRLDQVCPVGLMLTVLHGQPDRLHDWHDPRPPAAGDGEVQGVSHVEHLVLHAFGPDLLALPVLVGHELTHGGHDLDHSPHHVLDPAGVEAFEVRPEQ